MARGVCGGAYYSFFSTADHKRHIRNFRRRKAQLRPVTKAHLIPGWILNYKEEGREIEISAIFCQNISSVLSVLPGSIFYKVGEVEFGIEAGKTILKDCAPLCGRNWHLYISRISDAKVEYGVFSFDRSPTSFSLRDSMSLLSREFALLVHRIHVGTIEIIGSKGSAYHFEFSTTRQEVATSSDDHFGPFAKNCARSIAADEIKEKFIFYFANLLRRAVVGSHGTIVVCCENFNEKKPPEIADVVLIEPSLDFMDAFRSYLTIGSAESITQLNRLEELLAGFLSCDGIVVFDTSGGVVAYRGFYRSASPLPTVVGGARRRAFEGVKQLVGSAFVCALFQSQDGFTIYEGAPV